MDNTKEYINTAKTKTMQEFNEAYKFPFLVQVTEVTNEPAVKTDVTINAKVEDVLKEYKGMQIKKIIPLLKTKRNFISDIIIVGRAPSQDIVIDHAQISKTHAYFKTKDKINYVVCDNGSTNGTSINGQKIAPSKEIEIKNNDVIGFGTIFFRFFTSDSAYYTFKIFGRI
ncbi:MAG: FHA domain-containing protein [Candidatus Sericytochromatia bacterium]